MLTYRILLLIMDPHFSLIADIVGAWHGCGGQLDSCV